MDEPKTRTALVRVLDAVSAALFFIMFLMFIVGIVFRYVLGNPITWSLEFIMVSFILMFFWTIGLNLPLRRHVAFTIVYEALPAQGRRILKVISMVAGIAILVPSLPAVVSITIFEQRDSTPIIHIPFSLMYGSFVMFLVAFIVRLISALIPLFRADWRNHL